MTRYIPFLTLAISLFSHTAWTYGGGGGSDACEEPGFFEVHPTGVISSLAEFGFVASGVTDADSLRVEIGNQKIKPSVTKRRNGDWEAKAVLPEPLTQSGKVRVAITAQSRDGCSGFQAHFLEIKP